MRAEVEAHGARTAQRRRTPSWSRTSTRRTPARRAQASARRRGHASARGASAGPTRTRTRRASPSRCCCGAPVVCASRSCGRASSRASHEFPFPGWNESFNGSAPLAYVMGSWFRMVPAKPDAPFDVIPVDMVCKAMSIAGAALLLGRHAPVYHIGTSDRHRCSVGRAAELIVLAHRRYYREPGARAASASSSRAGMRCWSSPTTRSRSIAIAALLAACARRDRAAARQARASLEQGVSERIEQRRQEARADRADGRAVPAVHVRGLLRVRVEGDRAHARRSSPSFAYEPEVIDWRKYWIDVHMPGLRRWAFPLIEGKRPERYRPQLSGALAGRVERAREPTVSSTESSEQPGATEA